MPLDPPAGSGSQPTVLEPIAVAVPRHLDGNYSAPHRGVQNVVGRISLRRLGIDAGVVEVDWDRDAMAVPDDVATVGWFRDSAGWDDVIGAMLVAGHVADRSDHPGAMAPLVGARVGDVVEWRSGAGVISFRVTDIQRYPRANGLPTSLLRVDGPHVLRLVTCTTRQAGPAGLHYNDNLVVSAVEVGRTRSSGRTRSGPATGSS